MPAEIDLNDEEVIDLAAAWEAVRAKWAKGKPTKEQFAEWDESKVKRDEGGKFSDKVHAHITANPGNTAARIAKHLGADLEAVHEAVGDLREQGKVYKVPGGKGFRAWKDDEAPATPDQIATSVRSFLDNRHERSYQDIQKIVDNAGKLKAPELKSALEKIGVFASGTKPAMLETFHGFLKNIKVSADQTVFKKNLRVPDDLSQYQGHANMDAADARRKEIAATPPPPNEPAIVKAVVDHVASVIQANPYTEAAIPDVYESVKTKHPDLTPEAFKGTLARMNDRREINIGAYTSALKDLPKPEFAIPGASGIGYYLSPVRDRKE